MSNKGVRIRLENGGSAIVDNKDAPLVRLYRWFRRGPKGREYARGWIPQCKNTSQCTGSLLMPLRSCK